MKKPVLQTVPDVATALKFVAARASWMITHRPDEWAQVRSGDSGELVLAWRIQDGGQQLLLGRADDRPPTDGDLYEVRRALARAGFEEVSLQTLLDGTRILFHLQADRRAGPQPVPLQGAPA